MKLIVKTEFVEAWKYAIVSNQMEILHSQIRILSTSLTIANRFDRQKVKSIIMLYCSDVF